MRAIARLCFLGICLGSVGACATESESADQKSTTLLKSAVPLKSAHVQPILAKTNDRSAAQFETTVEDEAPSSLIIPEGMVWIPGGEFSMGSSDPQASGHCHEPMNDARPIHRVRVSGFLIDRTEVTNAQFRQFVAETNYITVAEQVPTEEQLPGIPAELRRAGSAVFQPKRGAVELNQPLGWWSYVAGASWRHSQGPDSDLQDRDDHPVVHIAYDDALAYARWAQKDLPTEAEWEFAARGGQAGKLYPWGDELMPQGKHVANTFQGKFPSSDSAADGFAGTSQVASFPPNGYGLFDMAGNVWEWTRDWYHVDEYSRLAAQGVATNPDGPENSFDPSEPQTKKRVQRGGSFLCSSEYCTRYMVGTRGKAEPNSPAEHTGFRCVRRVSAT